MKIALKAIVILSSLLLAGCKPSLPSCKDDEVINTVERLVSGKAYLWGKFYWGQFVDLKKIKQAGYDKRRQIRSCTASLITTEYTVDVEYQVAWINRKNEEAHVQIQPRQDKE